ncbi:MAG: hypothetical protein AB7W16_25075 [Candidatus Obscuribacterales bacterium]
MSAGDTSDARDLGKILIPAMVIVAVLGLLCQLFILLLHPLRIGFDQALYVTIGKMLLAGKTLYIDMVDNNPPLICYMGAIPAMVAEVFHMPPPTAFSFTVYGLICYSTAASLYAGTRMADGHARLSAAVLSAAIPFHGLFISLHRLVSLFNFGQREHLMMLACLPFFLLRWTAYQNQASNRVLAFVIGLIAGLGFCLKPWFLFIPFATEIYFLISTKRASTIKRPEMAGALAAFILYGLAILMMAPEARHAYFDLAVPTYLYGYAYFEKSTIYLLNYPATGSQHLIYLAGVCAIAASMLFRSSRLLIPVLVLMLGCAAVYFAQAKGWPYHLLPLSMAASLLAVLIVFESGRLLIASAWWRLLPPSDPKKNKLGQILVSIGAVAAVVATAIFMLNICVREVFSTTGENMVNLESMGYHHLTSPQSDLCYLNQYVMQYSRPGDPVAVIADNTEPGCALLLQLGRTQVLRHLDQARLCCFQHIRESRPDLWKSKFANLQRQYIEECIEDIAKFRPTLIIIKTGSLRSWLEEHDFTARALNGHYKQLGEADGYAIYRLSPGQDSGS